MPRDVKVRDSYQRDVAYLSRLSRAVEKDSKLAIAKKHEIIKAVNKLMMILLDATTR